MQNHIISSTSFKRHFLLLMCLLSTTILNSKWLYLETDSVNAEIFIDSEMKMGNIPKTILSERGDNL